MPGSVLSRARNNYLQSFPKNGFLEYHSIIELNDSTKVNLETAKVKVFYRLLNTKVNQCSHTGPLKWSKSLPINTEQWDRIFGSVKQFSNENKLREFQFKFLHRVVTKKELCKFGIKDNSECLYCGEEDSIEHTFSECHFTKDFLTKVVQWFNNCNHSTFTPSDQEYLFGVYSNLSNKKLQKKLISPCCMPVTLFIQISCIIILFSSQIL